MKESIVKNVKMIDVGDWDSLVESTYNRPYNFQQQAGCQPRGIFILTIPADFANEFDDEMRVDILESDEDEMGVKFKAWLSRDPKTSVNGSNVDWIISSFWERNFYPDIHMVANDLHSKGIIDAGEYVININW